ncbi:biotin--[acetyl-CoA-carboxylase] ligase [Lactiplantibacillus fabifermentans]|uniref:Bifunctional ligase/repressor BirA n=2 Tax=Lactiplantibacillus fabifermentans TaxID=483011 RepID=A0A0R2NW91_9LACO|nr:biotin--[acetyl-CoA-carboxylase] ligase [Lactiplantibacillus fabifermentans]ETY75088.1 biotin [Lactiplantibacillus fabifermentans T30PCM01]KRO28715.1 biotin--[acetyl-CoA-carboxylase] ligase and biotin operon repressor [Lactiplantibacillus fabifermentans DSM 21115]
MATQTEVLKLLQQTAPDYCSGDQLAQQLGLSRTAIWKAIQGLQTTGYAIESRHGLGYRYLENNQLDMTTIKSQTNSSQPYELIVLPTVDSTNAYLKRLATREPLTNPVVVVADTQTAGYGRSGRNFYSPSTTGLYMSIGLPIGPQQPLDAGLLTTSTAVVVARTLQQLFHVEVSLKWVNDVLVNHYKVVGILSEAVTDLESGQISTVIVGMGFNLTTQGFPTAIEHKAGAIAGPQSTVTRNQVISTLLTDFFAGYPTYMTGDFLPAYRQLSMVIGKQVELKSGADVILGTVQDIDATGALVVLTTNGQVRHLSSGEITKVNLLTGDYHG